MSAIRSTSLIMLEKLCLAETHRSLLLTYLRHYKPNFTESSLSHHNVLYHLDISVYNVNIHFKIQLVLLVIVIVQFLKYFLIESRCFWSQILFLLCVVFYFQVCSFISCPCSLKHFVKSICSFLINKFT